MPSIVLKEMQPQINSKKILEIINVIFNLK
jgi:hypothetical protein